MKRHLSGTDLQASAEFAGDRAVEAAFDVSRSEFDQERRADDDDSAPHLTR